MAEANVFFLYDIETEELLGFAAFEGTFKDGHLSDDGKSFVVDVDNYRFHPHKESIVPTVKDGAIHVGIYEIIRNSNSTAVDVEVIPLPCGPHPKFFAELMIPRFAEQARLEIERRRRKEAEKQARQLADRMMLMATMAASSTKKWSS